MAKKTGFKGVFMVEEEFKVRFHEMSPDRNVPVWMLQNYFQQAAAIDAEQLSYGVEELTSTGVSWALISIKFKFFSQINGIQNIKVKTWHCYSDKIYSRRDFIIYDENGNEAVHGTSLWVIIDLEKRRISKTPQAMLTQRLDTISDIEPKTLKMPSFEGQMPLSEEKVVTRIEDIDINNHVNNVHFTAWAMEGVPSGTQNSKTIKEITVDFKSEARESENITVKTYSMEENSFWHVLTRENDGKIIAAAHSVWV